MTSKPVKYILDTSCVPAAVGNSTTQHIAKFHEATADGSLSTSIYVRMEFLRLWICEYVRASIKIDLYSNVRDALFDLQQDFQIRKVKASMAVIIDAIEHAEAFDSPATATEEVIRLGYHLVRRFDRVLASRIQNACGCKLGGYSISSVDFDSIVEDMKALYEFFQSPIMDCEINDYLQLENPLGRANKLLGADGVPALSAGKALLKLSKKRKWITCTQCKRIGDTVIALEQPKAYTLLSIDASFDTLTQATGRKFKPLESLRAVAPTDDEDDGDDDLE